KGSAVSLFAQFCVVLHLANGHVCGSHAMQEFQPGLVGFRVAAMTIACASHRLNQAHALIVAQSVGGHSAPFRHASDRVTSFSHYSHPTTLSARKVNMGASARIPAVAIHRLPAISNKRKDSTILNFSDR